MHKKWMAISAWVLACVVLVVAGLYVRGVFGVLARHIEQDARKSQKIDGSWEVQKSIDDHLCAMIFYDKEQRDYVYSIYSKRGAFSLGYFFRSGGSSIGISDGITQFVLDENEAALISMNSVGIEKIRFDDNVQPRQIDIHPGKPFAVVIPRNCGTVLLLDRNGNNVPMTVVVGAD